MKALVASIWKFITFIAKVCLVSVFILLFLIVLLPDNALKAIEIVKGLFS